MPPFLWLAIATTNSSMLYSAVLYRGQAVFRYFSGSVYYSTLQDKHGHGLYSHGYTVRYTTVQYVVPRLSDHHRFIPNSDNRFLPVSENFGLVRLTNNTRNSRRRHAWVNHQGLPYDPEREAPMRDTAIHTTIESEDSLSIESLRSQQDSQRRQLQHQKAHHPTPLSPSSREDKPSLESKATEHPQKHIRNNDDGTRCTARRKLTQCGLDPYPSSLLWFFLRCRVSPTPKRLLRDSVMVTSVTCTSPSDRIRPPA